MNILESSGPGETLVDPSAIELPPTQPIDITELLKSQHAGGDGAEVGAIGTQGRAKA